MCIVYSLNVVHVPQLDGTVERTTKDLSSLFVGPVDPVNLSGVGVDSGNW